MPKELKLKSHDLLVGPSRAPARAMLKAVGFTDDDLAKPIVGVANTWIEVMPCNYHLRRLSERVKAGIRAAGGTPIEYNTIAVSDGISMGTEGMRASLISREVIADSIELVARGHLFDHHGQATTLQNHSRLPHFCLGLSTDHTHHVFLRRLKPGAHSSGSG